jgi:DNA-binding NarL/FixJ family response regulator
MDSRILFVDDEPKVLSGLRRALKKKERAWTMVFQSDPEQALRDYVAAPFDIVVTDMAMPNLNGIALVMEMRKVGHATNFIILTGTADLSVAMDAINHADVFRFFTKPCAAENLAEGIVAGLEDLRLRNPIENRAGVQGRKTDSLSSAIGLAALNRLALGVIVVSADCRIVMTNKAAGALIAARDGLLMSSGETLRASSPKDTDVLRQLIGAACAGTADEETPGLAIVRDADKRPLITLVLPLHDDSESGRAVVFVADTENQPLPAPDAIARMFGLSRAESRLVHALIGGARLDEAAEQCGVTSSTARSYLKQVFEKTNTSRQAELIKLVLTSPKVY